MALCWLLGRSSPSQNQPTTIEEQQQAGVNSGTDSTLHTCQTQMLRYLGLLRQRAAVVARPAPLRRHVGRLYSTSSSASQKQGGSGGPSVAAMIAVASMGFAAYSMLVKSREGQRK